MTFSACGVDTVFLISWLMDGKRVCCPLGSRFLYFAMSIEMWIMVIRTRLRARPFSPSNCTRIRFMAARFFYSGCRCTFFRALRFSFFFFFSLHAILPPARRWVIKNKKTLLKAAQRIPWRAIQHHARTAGSVRGRLCWNEGVMRSLVGGWKAGSGVLASQERERERKEIAPREMEAKREGIPPSKCPKRRRGDLL